jgi:hypothetical protein
MGSGPPAVRRDELDALPPALGRGSSARLLVVSAGGSSRPVGAADVEAGSWSAGSGRLVRGGLVVERSCGWLVVGPPGPRRLPDRPLGTGVALPEVGASLVLTEPAAAPELAGAPGWLPDRQALTLDAEPAGWAVRGARPGDTVVVRGRARPLRELMRAARVPRLLRGLLPVVVDDADVVRWMPGVAVADGQPAVGDRALLLLGPGGARPLGYPPDDDRPRTQRSDRSEQ